MNIPDPALRNAERQREVLDDLALLPPAPRRIRRRRGYFLIAQYHVALVFLLMFTHVAWLIALGTVKSIWFSQIVPAKVTRIVVIQKERGPSYEIEVTYQFGAAQYTDSLRMGFGQAQGIKEGDIVQVQVLAERPERAQRYYEHYPSRFVTVMICLIALSPTIGLGKLLWELYVVPWKLRVLMREGAATNGVIVDKKEVPGRQPTYSVTYEYPVPPCATGGPATSDMVTITASMKVLADDFQAAQFGDRVVVLYRPEQPRFSVIGSYADYEFVRTPDQA